MVGRLLLLMLVGFAIGLAGADVGDSGQQGAIDAITDDGSVVLSGQSSAPGRVAGSASGPSKNGSIAGPAAPIFIPPPPQGTCPDAIAPCGRFGSAAPTAPPAAPAAGTPAVTLADIASFRPTPTSPASEPNGWGIAGLDTNFVADARTQLVTGTLLGRPASVRFTPVAYTWTYGDGASRTTASPGTAWQRSGIREFDPTPSSHVYAAPGDYSAQLSIGYSAAYSWDGAAFTPIDGTVAVPSGSIPVHIVVESTVLVGGGCAPGSTAPGC